jgi:predicted ester cyclase
MTFLERWFEEVWNKGREEAIDEMALPNAKTHGFEGPDHKVVGAREAFKEFHQKFLSAFSNIHVRIEHAMTQGDMAMAHCVFTADHTGAGLGMPPTNKKVEVSGICLARLEGGKLAEAWNYFDLASLYRTLQ